MPNVRIRGGEDRHLIRLSIDQLLGLPGSGFLRLFLVNEYPTIIAIVNCIYEVYPSHKINLSEKIFVGHNVKILF